MLGNIINQFQLASFKKQRYNEIYQHELAHKNAAGAQGGKITILKDSQGVAFMGYTEIKMPQLDENNPDKTIEEAKVVIHSALAPKDPSSQDYKVAAKASYILAKALEAKSNQAKQKEPQNKLNIIA